MRGKKCGCGLYATSWKLKYAADLQGSWENCFSRDTALQDWKMTRVQKGETLMDPQNAVGAMQADKTVQLQTHPNYVLQLLYGRLWMRRELLFRRFIFQRFQEMKCNWQNSLEELVVGNVASTILFPKIFIPLWYVQECCLYFLKGIIAWPPL